MKIGKKCRKISEMVEGFFLLISKTGLSKLNTGKKDNDDNVDDDKKLFENDYKSSLMLTRVDTIISFKTIYLSVISSFAMCSVYSWIQFPRCKFFFSLLSGDFTA
jgi:hypothetical protein